MAQILSGLPKLSKMVRGRSSRRLFRLRILKVSLFLLMRTPTFKRLLANLTSIEFLSPKGALRITTNQRIKLWWNLWGVPRQISNLKVPTDLTIKDIPLLILLSKSILKTKLNMLRNPKGVHRNSSWVLINDQRL